MLTPLAPYHKAITGVAARYAFLRYLNTNTLAFVLFVAFALLSTIRAKEPQNNESAHPGDTNAESVIRPCATSVSAPQEIYAYTFSAKNPWNKIPRNR
jgi:hypothetical protein